MSMTPVAAYGDSYTIGQLAGAWAKSSAFVRRMIEEGKLEQDERGLVTNGALHRFYAHYASELD
jgi:hypothetical protein